MSKKLIIGIILVLVGILVSVLIITGENQQNEENTVVKATVTKCKMISETYDITDGDTDRVYRISVRYTYNGEQYNSSFEYTSKADVGEDVEIHIDPNDPMKVDGMYGGLIDYSAPILFLGLPLTLGGGFLVFTALKNRNQSHQENVA